MHLCLALALACLPAAARVAAAADGCPPPPAIGAEAAPLMAAVAEAPDAEQARLLMNGLWLLWTRAPDAAAQEMLDRGMARREAYDFDGALAQFDRLVAYCPDWAEGWNQRSFIRFLKEDYAAALADVDEALARAPQHIGALAGRALVLLNLGQREAGQAALKEALKLNPWLPERGYLLPEPPPPGQKL